MYGDDRGAIVQTEIHLDGAGAALLLGYLLGSIPFGVMLTRLFGAGDLRTIGSGNIGATNVLRTGRKGLAAATLLLDLRQGRGRGAAGRAAVPGQRAARGGGGVHRPLLSGLAEVQRRQGRRDADGDRAGAPLAARAGLCGRCGWGCSRRCGSRRSRAWPRRSSAPVAAALFGRFDLVLLLLALALIVVWKHRDNIERLLAGTEPRVGARSRVADAAAARLRLIRTPGIGPVTYRQLIARFGTAAAAIEALPMLARRGGGSAPRWPIAAAIEREMAATARLGARYLFIDDPDYPPLLAEIENAPPALIVRGDIALRAPPCVAIVGARNASAAACRFARQLAHDLAAAGATRRVGAGARDRHRRACRRAVAAHDRR